MAVLKNVENKIKLVMIVSCLFLVGCIVISLGSIVIAKTMVDEAHKKIYVLDGNVPKRRATSKCSTICSLPLRQTISIYNIR